MMAASNDALRLCTRQETLHCVPARVQRLFCAGLLFLGFCGECLLRAIRGTLCAGSEARRLLGNSGDYNILWLPKPAG
jgi:hypothetical protein